MSANRARDTSPERAVRQALWRAGLRGYRLNARGVPGRPDIIFRQAKLAIFVHGCFWHACPKHAHEPKSNAKFWEEKFARNRERDARKLAELRAAGWRSIVVWEHDIPARLDRVVADVRRRLGD